MCKVRSENGYGFLSPGLKTGVGYGIFWSEIGFRFGDAGSTPPTKIPRSTPPPFLGRALGSRTRRAREGAYRVFICPVIHCIQNTDYRKRPSRQSRFIL